MISYCRDYLWSVTNTFYVTASHDQQCSIDVRCSILINAPIDAVLYLNSLRGNQFVDKLSAPAVEVMERMALDILYMMAWHQLK